MTCKTIVLSLVLLAFSMSTLAMGANSSTSAIEECVSYSAGVHQRCRSRLLRYYQCRRLDQQLPGRVLYPGMAYNESNIRWSTTAMLHPSCIVRPRNASDVSEAIVTLAGNDTNRSSCPFAIRSGGHTPTPRANDINNGITMDLRNINDTVLSPDHKSATIGTGSDWLNVYTTLDGTGVGVPGGRYGLVGVGGIALGGGLSFVSPKVGWVTDNVLAFEIVLASGEIITANRTHHPDLWHALKGGSSNFGIITRAEIMTFSSDGKFWGGSVVYPHSTTTTSQVLSALNEFTTNNHQDQNAASNTNFIYNATSGKKEIANTIVYSQDIANASIFGGIQSIQPQLANTAESTTIVELAANTASLPKGYRYGGATVTFKNPPEALVAAQSVTDSIYETVANVTDLVFTFVYEPIPRIYAEHSIERGGNIMGMESTVEDLIRKIRTVCPCLSGVHD